MHEGTCCSRSIALFRLHHFRKYTSGADLLCHTIITLCSRFYLTYGKPPWFELEVELFLGWLKRMSGWRGPHKLNQPTWFRLIFSTIVLYMTDQWVSNLSSIKNMQYHSFWSMISCHWDVTFLGHPKAIQFCLNLARSSIRP